MEEPTPVDRSKYAASSDLNRFIVDLQTLDGVGVERGATAWGRGFGAYTRAEKAALRYIEQSNLVDAWAELRERLTAVTTSAQAPIAWRSQEGAILERASRAAFGAAFGLFARGGLGSQEYAALVEPMVEALPWLLSGGPPAAVD